MNANYTISHASYTGYTAADGTAGPPQYGTVVSRKVFGWYPLSSEVPIGDDDVTHRVETSLVVMVPDVSPYKVGDKLTIGAKDYLVYEDVRDFTTGPFGYKPGGALIVERVSG